jgi:hypothetical protein
MNKSQPGTTFRLKLAYLPPSDTNSMPDKRKNSRITTSRRIGAHHTTNLRKPSRSFPGLLKPVNPKALKNISPRKRLTMHTIQQLID